MYYTNLCLGCIKEKCVSKTCPYCGYEVGTALESAMNLLTDSVLQIKFILG